MYPMGESVSIVRGEAPVFPTMGDAPATASTTVIDGCAIWPTVTTEIVTGQDTVTWDLECLLPPDTDILPTDRVLFDGETYDVVGRPMRWRSPITGRKPGIQVNLKSQTG